MKTTREIASSLALLAMTTLCFAASQSESPGAFDQANALYKSGDFKGAYEAYQKLAEKGPPSAALCYNLGNAALRAGRKGKAVAAYERALLVNPRDENLRWNIQVLRGALPDRMDDAGDNPAWSVVRRAVDFLSLNELAVFLNFALALLAVFSAFSFLFPKTRAFMRAPVFLSAAAAAALVFLFTVKWLDEKDPRVVILDKEVTARYGPSDRETKAFALHEGAEGRVRDETPDWYYVVLGNKNSGWVRKSACEVV